MTLIGKLHIEILKEIDNDFKIILILTFSLLKTHYSIRYFIIK